MRKKLLEILTLLCALMAALPRPAGGVTLPDPQREWTVMVYAATANNLETFTFRDLAKLTASSPRKKPVAAAMLVATEHYGNWKIAVASDPRALDGVGLTRLDTLSMPDMRNLSNFLRDSAARFPAKRYALIIQSHGSGWYLTMEPGHTVSVPQIAAAIRDSGIPLEIIGFDMCLMATIETVYELRGFAKFVLASEDYGPWEGLISPELLSIFSGASDTLGVLRELSRSFIARNDNDPESDPADISILDMAAVEGLTHFLQTTLPQTPLDASYFSPTDSVDRGTESPYWNLQDLSSLMHRALAGRTAELRQFDELFGKVVVGYWQDSHKRATDFAAHHHGLSIVLNGDQDDFDKRRHYREVTFPVRLVTSQPDAAAAEVR